MRGGGLQSVTGGEGREIIGGCNWRTPSPQGSKRVMESKHLSKFFLKKKQKKLFFISNLGVCFKKKLHLAFVFENMAKETHQCVQILYIFLSSKTLAITKSLIDHASTFFLPPSLVCL